MLRGFDVSHWQGVEDWRAMKAAHQLDFGFIKATESTTFRDNRFPVNWPAIRDAGLVRGAYHFARPSESPAVDQADYFLDYVGANGGLTRTDVPILDFETSGGLGTNAGLRWCIEWADHVRSRTGLIPMLYVGSWAVDDVTVPQLRDHFCAWWFPRYPTVWANRGEWPTDYADCNLPAGHRMGELPDIWQYSQSFPVGGEAHDANVSRLEPFELRILNMLTMNEHDAPSEDAMTMPAVMTALGQTQPYFVDGSVKRKVSTAVATYLTATVGVSVYRDVPVAVLNLWPTLAVDANGMGQDAATQALSKVNAVAAAQGDDATAAQVTAVGALVTQVLEKLSAAQPEVTSLSADTLVQIGDAVVKELSARLAE